MSTMEDILANQQQLQSAIEQIYTNFKKDGSDRKTSDYIRRRLETLDAYWNDYQANHRRLCSIHYVESHSYFTSKQFDVVKEQYEKIREVIQQYQRPDDRPSTPSLKPATPLATQQTSSSGSSSRGQGTNSKTDEMIRKQLSNFKAFEHSVSKVNLDIVSEKWEFEHLLKTVQDRWSKIDSQHWELDSEIGDKNQDYSNMYLKYENTYNDAIKAINKKMWSISHREQSTPKIDIPTFSGSYNQWTSFKDLFTESIHNNTGLSGAQKMQFLKSKVKGEAERLIQHLPITSDNYIISWDILNHRYDNKRMIFTSHINNLLNLPISTQASISHIKRIHDSTQETLNAIKNLGVDVTSWDPLVVHILCQKLDSETFSEYNTAIKQPRELPSLNEFLSFLESKFMSMEVSRRKQENFNQKPVSSNSKPAGNNYTKYNKSSIPKQTYASNNNKVISSPSSSRKLQFDIPNCPICNDNHAIYFCKQFSEMAPQKKKQLVASLNYCQNCLYDHNGKACLSKERCRECNEFHNTLLHESYNQHKPIATPSASTQQDNVRSKGDRVQRDTTHVAQQNVLSEILLSTALLKVQAVDGTYLSLRALIDQGSQTSLITENGAQLLGLPRQRCNNIITGIGRTENSCKGMLNLNCISTISSYSFQIDVYIMKNLTKYLPSYTFDKLACPFLENIELADPDYNISRPIDLLLGADVYSNIILGGMCRFSETLPIVQQTRLGWILCGGMKSLSCNVVQMNLDEIQQFWEIEEVTENTPLSSEDTLCMEFYKSTTKRLEDGRYQVRLPLKPDFQKNLGHSKKKATAQFLQLEKKLHKNISIFSEYKSFINEYKQLGHMRPSTSNLRLECFLPHHCVLRKDSTTTALRVVYNASAKTSTNISLNDLMYTGPNLQQDLQSLILRWRQYRYAFTADIEKMFRQIWIHPDDQCLQKILWRDDPYQHLQEYQLTTVTYGTKAAPFLAMMTLRQLAIDERHKFPQAAKVIEESFYMDDVAHGGHSLAAAKKIQEDLRDLLQLGGFNLRKWISNSKQLLQQQTQDYLNQQCKNFTQTEQAKTLGVCWNPIEDKFTFLSQTYQSNYKITKRNILSDLSKVFDPLGWIAPVTAKLKILFQQTWLLKVQWDEQVPDDISKEWVRLRADLENINQINIPRWYNTQIESNIELHGFCDASTKSYACVIYIKINNAENHVTLVAGKSKLVPTSKQISLPRLELCGALLLARLMEKVKVCLSDYNTRIFGWCDSTAVLGWLHGEPGRWKTFVANRTRQITSVIPPNSWRYVKSQENPADCASRGLTVSQLREHELWWCGPTWLTSFEETKERTMIYTTDEEINNKIIPEQVNTVFKHRFLSFLEACLNTRPLCPISEDPDDLDYLTPAHFLAGSSNVNIYDTEIDLRTRWHLTQKIVKDLWKRWQHEYLLQITSRSKWQQAKQNVKIDDVVTVHDENLPPGKWLMGRVIEIHPGADGRVRVVTLKTKNGTLKRPITKISILPVNEEIYTQQKNGNHSDSYHSVRTSKTIKTNRFNISSIFTAIILFLSIITTSQGSLNITKFRNNQHLYFDKLTDMQIIRNDWKLVIYYNMEPYWEGITALNKSIMSIEQSCNLLPERTPCDIILLQLHHGLNELEYNNHMLLSQQIDTRPNRWRRGLIDGVGYIANSLFGVLDSRFAEQYEKDITLLRNNQKHIASFWQNQTSVIEGEFSLLKRTEENMHRQHKLIHQQLSNIDNSLSLLKAETQNISLSNQAFMGGIIASNLLHDLKYLQNTLIDTITDVYHGRFNPHIITAQQLQDQLSTISSHLLNDITLPIENIHTDLVQIYKLLTIKARILRNYSIFEVQVPLISRDTYEVFKLIPIPFEKDNNMMTTIRPSFDIVALNLKKDAYIIMTENGLNSCLMTNIHLCHIHTPVYKLNINKDFCQTNRSDCEVSIRTCKNTWSETHSMNSYVYFCCGQCQVRTICGNQITSNQLDHSGIISVELDCIMKSDTFEISAHEQKSSNAHLNANIAPVIAPINRLINLSIPYDFWNESSTENEQAELQALHDKIKMLKKNGELADTLSYHDVHHYTAIYVVIGIAGAALVVYMWKRARGAAVRAPGPARVAPAPSASPRAAPAPAHPPGGGAAAAQHQVLSDSVLYQCVSERATVASAKLSDKATSPILASLLRNDDPLWEQVKALERVNSFLKDVQKEVKASRDLLRHINVRNFFNHSSNTEEPWAPPLLYPHQVTTKAPGFPEEEFDAFSPNVHTRALGTTSSTPYVCGAPEKHSQVVPVVESEYTYYLPFFRNSKPKKINRRLYRDDFKMDSLRNRPLDRYHAVISSVFVRPSPRRTVSPLHLKEPPQRNVIPVNEYLKLQKTTDKTTPYHRDKEDNDKLTDFNSNHIRSKTKLEPKELTETPEDKFYNKYKHFGQKRFNVVRSFPETVYEIDSIKTVVPKNVNEYQIPDRPTTNFKTRDDNEPIPRVKNDSTDIRHTTIKSIYVTNMVELTTTKTLLKQTTGNEHLRKITGDSSYSDEETALKINLLDQLYHYNKTVLEKN